MNCPICYSEMKKEIKCPHCPKTACINCYQTFFLKSNNQAQCIYKCSDKYWNIQYLSDNFPRKFLWGSKDSYRSHRENILLEQQLILMESTQPQVEKEIEVNKLLKQLKENIHEIKNTKNNQLHEINREIITKILKLRKKKEIKIKNRGKCTKCIGFISKNWKCGLCDNKICKYCRENHEENHICKEENVKSIEHLKTSSYKNCPNCNVIIEKSEGCNQMFCVQCNIFFDWQTGEKIKKTQFVHNPHYQEWIEKNNITASPEGVDENSIKKLEIKIETKQELISILRYVNEIRNQVEIDTLDIVDKLDEELLDFRKKYLHGLIDKKSLGILVQRSYKKESKANETNQIKNMFSESCVTILSGVTDNNSEMKIEEIKIKITEAEKNLKKIGLSYNSTVPSLNKWSLKFF